MIFTANPVEFLYHYSTYVDKEKLRARIQKHFEFKTCLILYDTHDLVCAICLWNIVDDGKAAHIVDLVFREDKRKHDLMRKILMNGMRIWPVKFIVYDRDYTRDGANRGRQRIWSVERFLRRKA